MIHGEKQTDGMKATMMIARTIDVAIITSRGAIT